MRILTPRGRKHILAAIKEVVQELDPKRKVRTIGIGIPGFTDTVGKIIYMPHLSEMVGTNIAQELKTLTKRKILVENDAKCFTLAEQLRGAAKGKKHVIGLTLGTGVGCGIIVDGKIYKGANGGAGEIGHTIIAIEGKLMHIEDLLSGPALLSEYEKLSGHIVHDLSDLHDKYFHKVYHRMIKNLSLLCTNLIDVFNPEVIVFGGGVSNIDFYDDLKENVKTHVIKKLYKDCKILKNKLGDDAGAIGAALLG